MCSHSPSQVRAFNLGRVILGCVPTPEESCHQQTSSSDPPAGLHLYPPVSFPTIDKVKLILPGWALTFCPSTATTQRCWESAFHAWSQPWHGRGQSQVTSLVEHMDLPHNEVVPWDVQPVAAHSIHTNHQSYFISLLLKFCDIFTSVDFNNKGEVLYVSGIKDIVKNVLMEGPQGKQEKSWMQRAHSNLLCLRMSEAGWHFWAVGAQSSPPDCTKQEQTDLFYSPGDTVHLLVVCSWLSHLFPGIFLLLKFSLNLLEGRYFFVVPAAC